MPASENAMTGVAIGASLNGIRPVMTHQWVDFFLLAMDQLVNNAAKSHYMFGGKKSVPITIRRGDLAVSSNNITYEMIQQY